MGRLTQLKPNEQADLLALARETLQEKFYGTAERAYENFLLDPLHCEGIYEQLLPCFLTLTLRKRLRGCIGALATLNPLSRNVHDYALSAAFGDPRFRPLMSAELPHVRLAITVLGPMQPLPSPDSIHLGLHGLCVRSEDSQGVLLAQVAVENKWSVPEFIAYTCEKAGLLAENWQSYQFFYFEEVAFSE